MTLKKKKTTVTCIHTLYHTKLDLLADHEPLCVGTTHMCDIKKVMCLISVLTSEIFLSSVQDLFVNASAVSTMK